MRDKQGKKGDSHWEFKLRLDNWYLSVIVKANKQLFGEQLGRHFLPIILKSINCTLIQLTIC